MEILIGILGFTTVCFLALSVYLFKQNTQAVEKAEKNIFELFMAGAYANRLLWFETLNQRALDDPVVFIGDSLIEEWPLQELFTSAKYLNRGIGGDTTTNLLQRLDHTFAGLSPEKIVLLIGTNDLNEPETTTAMILENITGIVAKLKTEFPAAQVHMLSLLPVGDKDDPGIDPTTVGARSNTRIRTINDKLETLDDVIYHDVHRLLVDQKGYLDPAFTREGLHLSPRGYLVLSDHLKQAGL